MNKKIILPIIAVSVIGVGLVGIGQAQASTTDSNPVNSLVDMISSKFHLDKNQVQSVFDLHHNQIEQKRQDNLSNRLDQAVKDGKISSSQKQLILDEMTKLKNEYPLSSFKDKSKEERIAQHQKMKDEIKSWADSVGIDLTKIGNLGLFPGGAFRGHMGRHMDR